MSFRTEPGHTHGQRERTAVLLVNLGTPDAPTAAALRRYLAEFLSDPRVVEIPRLPWWLILHGAILRLRPAKSAAKYASIWTADGSPLAVWTRRQADGVAIALEALGHDVIVEHAMRYGNPSIASVLDSLRQRGATRLLVLPLYPQYAAATTASVADSVMEWARSARRMPEFRFVHAYHDDPGYIAALVTSVQMHWLANGRAQKLVMSFHGLPYRSLLLGDPYFCHCHKTARLVAEGLELAEHEWMVTFQSRLGRARWLEPYTEPTLRALPAQGVRSVDIMCPGFVADCLETLEEISMEGRQAFFDAGGSEFRYIACLNAAVPWIDTLASLADRHLQGWLTDAGLDDETALEASRRRATSLGATR